MNTEILWIRSRGGRVHIIDTRGRKIPDQEFFCGESEAWGHTLVGVLPEVTCEACRMAYFLRVLAGETC